MKLNQINSDGWTENENLDQNFLLKNLSGWQNENISSELLVYWEKIRDSRTNSKANILSP